MNRETSVESPILEPLVFGTAEAKVLETLVSIHDLPCIMNECDFSSSAAEELISHIAISHKIVVADLKVVPDLKGYLEYWKKKLTKDTITNYCYGIKALVSANEGHMMEEDIFYMLSDTLPEDKELRGKLQQKRLQEVIQKVEQERTDQSFNRRCLFCNSVFTNNRSVLFNHLKTKHNLFLGSPDNIVYCREFLDLIEEKLKKLICLYCENTFKSREVLLEHMRKKGHKHLNPDNHEYDRFYVINYTELGKTWQDLKGERSSTGDYTCYRTPNEVIVVRDEDSDSEGWSDWEENEQCVGAVCLFCESKFADSNVFESHLNLVHGFDFQSIKKQMNLNFYQQVKLVNYIRRQVHQRKCIFCRKEFPTKSDLDEHMKSEGHTKIPEESVWDQTEYFFPTYEDDSLLLLLEEEESKSKDEKPTDVHVIAEDLQVPPTSVLLDENLRKELKIV